MGDDHAMRPHGRAHTRLQHQWVSATVRILAEREAADISAAIRKAAERLGITDRRQIPGAETIVQAIEDYRRLFLGEHAIQQVHRLRLEAIAAMQALARFQPRLVGAVLDGSADETDPVCLHLFADCAEEVAFSLIERRIPWQDEQTTRTLADGQRLVVPVFRFYAGTTEFRLLVLPWHALRQPPLDPSSQKPAARATVQRVQALLAGAGD
jgi:hypothetical protein